MIDPRVSRLKTYEDCLNFVVNVEKDHPELAQQARKRGVLLRAETYGATNDAEREAIEVVYALEDANALLKGKKTPANRTWQAIKANGILATVEKMVQKRAARDGYEALIAQGLGEFTFEAVVLRHQELFSSDAVHAAKVRQSINID